MTMTNKTKTMVCGFLIHRSQVLLVRKQNPDWQRGLFNGVGGCVEDGERPEAAMVHEFHEETGLRFVVPRPGEGPPRLLDWHCFVREHEPWGAVVHFFRAHVLDCDPRPEVPPANDVGEELVWAELNGGRLPPHARAVGNLSWLLPMILDWRGTCGDIFTGGDMRQRATWA